MPPLLIGGWTLDLRWFGWLVGTIAIAWILNLYNFMDGIDGLAGSEALSAGSGFIGFFLGALGIASARLNPAMLWVWVILLAVFEADATMTLLRRMARGDRWYAAHRSHAYQHAAQRWGHQPVTVAVLLYNLVVLSPMAWLAWKWPNWGLPLAILAVIPPLLVAWRCGAGTPHGNLAKPAGTTL